MTCCSRPFVSLVGREGRVFVHAEARRRGEEEGEEEMGCAPSVSLSASPRLCVKKRNRKCGEEFDVRFAEGRAAEMAPYS